MADEALIRLAPGFKHDHDEDWLVYSPPERQITMRRERAKYIEIKEYYKTFVSSFRQSNDTSDPIKIREFEEKKKKVEEKINMKAMKLLKDIELYKREAEETKLKRLQEEENAMIKRRRMEEEEDVIEIEEVELVADDYLPNFLPYDAGNTEEAATPVDYSPAITNEDNNIPMDVGDNMYTNEENLLKDVNPEDAFILNKLKPLILKYNCRDRVLKYINSVRCLKKNLAVLESFTGTVARSAASRGK